MNKEKILFDWDDTLFSKTVYKKNLITNLARVSDVSEEKATKANDEYFSNLIKSGDFKIEDYLKCFEEKFNKKISLEDFSTDKLGIYSNALFLETIEVLEKMKDRYYLGIYSQGFDGLQRIKIKYSGIELFFDQNLIFVDRDKTRIDLVKKLPVGATVIDDKKEVIKRLKQMRKDLRLIWINRIDDETIDGVLTIKKLDDLINLI